MVKKPTPAPPAEDNQKTAAADAIASGPVTPATGSEGEAPAAEASAESPAAGAGPVAGAPADMITVFGPAKGRWRAGRFFGPEGTQVELATLTDDQLLALHADPELVVTGPT
jgi:hypothetical protein